MSFYNNADWNQAFTVTSGGSPVNLTGKTLRMAVRASASGPDLLVATTLDGTLTVTDGPAGKFSMAVPYADTAGVPAGNHYWDLLDILSPTSRTRLAGGRILVREGITE